MTGAYVYTPAIWPPTTAAIFLAVLGLYSWRRRSVLAARPLVASLLFGALWMLGIALEVAAVAPGAKIAWHQFQALWQLPASTTMACFALEYAYPGRWLTRRNLILLVIPPLVNTLLIVTGNAQLIRLEIASDGWVVRRFGALGAIMMGYGLSLGLVNMAAFLWLFIRSPQHRGPVALMLLGDLLGRGLYGLYGFSLFPLPVLTLLNSFVASLLLNWTMYAIALFGFRIFDPLPAARRTAIEQMREGMVVFDNHGRVASLNPAAAGVLAIPPARVRGKTLQELLPASPDWIARIADLAAAPLDKAPATADISLGTGPETRHYALMLSLLKDFRGLAVGRLLLLSDVTEQRRAQTQRLEQQRASAMLEERDRLARELHDDLGQVLSYVKMQAHAARAQLAQDEKGMADDCLAQLIRATQEAHIDVREYIFGARLTPDSDFDFLPALEQYLRRFTANYGIRTELIVPPEFPSDAFAPVVQAQLLRIIQEALTNARKHAQPERIQISFKPAGNRAQVTIRDDGGGFDPEQATGEEGHFGLHFMRQRAEEVGARLVLVSGPGCGTQITVDAPLRAREVSDA